MGSDWRVPKIAAGVGQIRFRCWFDAQVLSEVQGVGEQRVAHGIAEVNTSSMMTIRIDRLSASTQLEHGAIPVPGRCVGELSQAFRRCVRSRT
jgi:hypothetical protein